MAAWHVPVPNLECAAADQNRNEARWQARPLSSINRTWAQKLLGVGN